MSTKNPKYPPLIQYINNLRDGQIVTLDDVCKALEKQLPKSYVIANFRLLATKEFYIGKNFNKEKPNKIDSYYKKRNIPTDKTLTDIVWFLKYDL